MLILPQKKWLTAPFTPETNEANQTLGRMFMTPVRQVICTVLRSERWGSETQSEAIRRGLLKY